MNRILTVKDRNYTTVNNTILKDKRVSLKAKGLFVSIMSLPDNWDFTIRGLISIMKEEKTAIYNAIDELVSFGYCQVNELRDNGQFAGNDYTFFEFPYADLPYTENPHTVNPHTENVPQLSKKESNKKESSKKEVEREQKPAATAQNSLLNTNQSNHANIERKEITVPCAQQSLTLLPSIEVVQEFFPLFHPVNEYQYNLLKSVTNISAWRKTVQHWAGNGWKIKNVEGMVDRYKQTLSPQASVAQNTGVYVTPAQLDAMEAEYIAELRLKREMRNG